MAGAVGIVLLVYLGEVIIEQVTKEGNDNRYKKLGISILKNSLYIIVAFVFVGIANNKVSSLNDANKGRGLYGQ